MLQIYETVYQEIRIPRRVEPVLGHYTPEYLRGFGIPEEWIGPLREVDQDGLLEIASKLPPYLAEVLLDLAAGKTLPHPPRLEPRQWWKDPRILQCFSSPEDLEQLRLALLWPWKRWLIFLHPAQREAVQRSYNGPARLSGPAGTGKTVVLAHRAVALARRYREPILVTSFNRTLAQQLNQMLEELQAPPHLKVTSLHREALRLYREHFGQVPEMIGDEKLRPLIDELRSRFKITRPLQFLFEEWTQILDPWGIKDLESYIAFPRTGRGIPLSRREHLELWPLFAALREELAHRQAQTFRGLCHELARSLSEPPYRAILVDEAQDLSPAELTLLRAMVPEAENNLFFALDADQRIYQLPFSWHEVGLEIQGRSHKLRVNYRTTGEIYMLAQRIRHEPEEAISLLQGPPPQLCRYASPREEGEGLFREVDLLLRQGFKPREIALLARTLQVAQERIQAPLKAHGLNLHQLSEEEPPGEELCYGTFHRAKGLEFRAVILVGVEEGLLPYTPTLQTLLDPQAKEDFEIKERNLLYVALTRARERLIITYVGAPSPFLKGFDLPAGAQA